MSEMSTGALATFTWLSPSYARYDYGFMIFIVTFSVISVCRYREPDLLGFSLVQLEMVILGYFMRKHLKGVGNY